jgi:cytochrome c oxidase subunit 3
MFGVWLALAPIFMLFAALATAFLVRQEIHLGWGTLEMPRVLWLNTALLMASSLTLERGRRLLHAGAPQSIGDGERAAAPWFWATLWLGLAFVVGQVVAWVQLMTQGIATRGSAHGVFFFLLTGAHALHVMVGLGALALLALWPPRVRRRLTRELAARMSAVYWHFLLLLWVALFVLLITAR